MEYLIAKASTNSLLTDKKCFICSTELFPKLWELQCRIQAIDFLEDCEVVGNKVSFAQYWGFYENISILPVLKTKDKTIKKDSDILFDFSSSNQDYTLIDLIRPLSFYEEKGILNIGKIKDYTGTHCKIYKNYIQFLSYPKHDDFEIYSSEINLDKLKI